MPRSSPWLTFGHEILSSIAARPGSAPSISAIATNWSSSSPAMFAITAVPTVRKYGRWWSIKCWIPSLSRPIALRSPEAVSAVRGVGLPARLEGHGLRDHAPQPLEPNEGRHFADIAKCSRSDEHGILEDNTTQRHVQVDHTPALAHDEMLGLGFTTEIDSEYSRPRRYSPRLRR